MIQLTRLNNHLLAVNSDLIKYVERAPDSVITLISGEKLVVRESVEEILHRIIEFRRSILQGLGRAWDGGGTPSPAAEESAELEQQE
jgi:flagellar protein FlbD